jgi:Flp pilus assembly protein TadG
VTRRLGLRAPSLFRHRRARTRGQSLVEFAIGVPVFMLLLLGMIEFGFVFTHHIGLEYASREGARMGAALASGSASIACADVDSNVIAALQRVVTSPGSQIAVGNITQIQIYSANSSGNPIGTLINTWVPGTGPTVDGVALQFRNTATGWPACPTGNRNNGTTPDSIGVRLTYNYDFVTPLGNFISAFSSGRIVMTDKTVMALNPGAN